MSLHVQALQVFSKGSLDTIKIFKKTTKQQKMSKIWRAIRNTHYHKILMGTVSICVTSDKLVNSVLLRVQRNHSLRWLQREMEDFRAYFWSV